MRRVVRRSALALGLVATLAGGLVPQASAAPNKAYLKMQWNCSRVGDVTVTISGPGVKASGRDKVGTQYFQGRAGTYIVKRLANGRIAPKTAYLTIAPNTTRTVLVCNDKW
ncbi:hypothetical protein [Kribbella sp. DT2]|uniref:hypothetical protein n=1 Tax=Kribbella sp. DT2 TaxID=3393427 RepID=UPI003CEDB6AD